MQKIPNMKKYVFLLICIMAAISVLAEDNSKEYHVRLTKTDGTVFEGYNNTRLRNWLKPKVTSVSISEEYKGPAVKYTSEEV